MRPENVRAARKSDRNRPEKSTRLDLNRARLSDVTYDPMTGAPLRTRAKKDERLTVRLTEDFARRLRAAADADGVSLSAWMRSALTDAAAGRQGRPVQTRIGD